MHKILCYMKQRGTNCIEYPVYHVWEVTMSCYNVNIQMLTDKLLK